MVQDRLVEAWGFLRRMPDREGGWLSGGVSSLWREVVIDRSDRWIDRDEARPARVGLRTAEVERMEEALGWVEWTRESDRKLIGMALDGLASGQAHVEWGMVRARLGFGDALPAPFNASADALRKRYGRAISLMVHRLSH